MNLSGGGLGSPSTAPLILVPNLSNVQTPEGCEQRNAILENRVAAFKRVDNSANSGFDQAASASERKAAAGRRPSERRVIEGWIDPVAARALSGTDFDLPPSAFQMKARSGDVAAVTRRQDRPCKRGPRPRNSAEAEVARGDNPRDRLGWVRKWLGQGGSWRRKGTGRENAHEQSCTFRHAETFLDRGQTSDARAASGLPLTDNACDPRPQGVPLREAEAFSNPPRKPRTMLGINGNF